MKISTSFSGLLLLLIIGLNQPICGQNLFPDPGKVYNDEVIPKIFISVDTSDLMEMFDSLVNDRHFRCQVIFDNGNKPDTIENVGLRLRGNTSLFSAKKSYKLSFNTFEPGRQYKGLEKMNLNGEHNDPSVVRSKICWDLCRQMGIPAPRANHVELYINDFYWGLYINVEHIDDEFVQKRWGDPIGNLYKCLWPATLEYWGELGDRYKRDHDGRRIYELKTNKSEDDYSDLAEFIKVLNFTSRDDLQCELEKVFDVQNYLKAIAMDVLTGNWDGPIFNKNNFYLYRNPKSGKFQYIPYDLDNTLGIEWFGRWIDRDPYEWSPRNEPRPLYTKILQNSVYRSQLTYYLNLFIEEYYGTAEMRDRIDDFKEKLEESIEVDPFYPLDYDFSLEDFLTSYDNRLDVGHVAYGLKEFIDLRRRSAIQQLDRLNTTPIITEVEAMGASASQDILITATIEDESVRWARVNYELNGIRGSIELFDDGSHSDGEANDMKYGAIIPALDQEGVLQYSIEVEDVDENENRFPYCEELALNLTRNTYGIHINEFQARNDNTIADENGEYDDWIELYNSGGTSVNLSQFFLSDDFGEPQKWQLPNKVIGPDEYLILWADNDPGEFHAPFKLSGDGEQLVLSHQDGQILEEIRFGVQDVDGAEGRIPNGTGAIQSVVPTPGASNIPLSNVVDLNSVSIEMLPNPATEYCFVHATSRMTRVEVYSSSGLIMNQSDPKGFSYYLQLSNWANGAYFVKLFFTDENVVTKKLIINR